jgi:ABC-type multidrug transport system ATPase subunit
MSVVDDGSGLVLAAVRTRLGRRRSTGSLDVAVPGGSTVHLHGPNGCGKTSALALLAGRLSLRAGRATFRGDPLARARRAGRVVVLGPELLPLASTSFEQWATSRSRFHAVAPERLSASVDRWSVSDYWGEPMDRLSAGMRWRCALAFAFAADGALVGLDEPDAHLDALGQDLLARELVDVPRRTGGVAVVASHHLVLPPTPTVVPVALQWCGSVRVPAARR